MDTQLPEAIRIRYSYEGKKGQGRNGVVYKVRNNVNNRIYALKTVRPDAEDRSKAADDLLKEIEFLIKADHRLLPRIYDHSKDGETPYFVSSFHPGDTFEDFIKHDKRFHLNEAMITILSLIDVLDYIHSTRGAHCDLHPRNILISENVFQYGVMLIDFGSGHVWSDSSPETKEGGDFRYKPSEIQGDHRKQVTRYGRADAWMVEDFIGLGNLLGKMSKVFMGSANNIQTNNYFALCQELRAGSLTHWGEVKDRVFHVFHPYYAIESNADLLGQSDDYCRTVCLPVTGHLRLHSSINTLVESDEFQKIQQIKQLSFCDWGYSGANHTRYEHSLGVYHSAQRLLDVLGRTAAFRRHYTSENVKAMLVAALVHDVGHYPFAHPFEQFAASRFPRDIAIKSLVSHAKRSIQMLDKGMSFGDLCRRQFGDAVINYAQRILEGKAGALSGLISSAVDLDKIDYLRRDSYHCGLPYGLGNTFEHLIQCFRIHQNGKQVVITEDAIPAVEGFLLLQDQMLTDVYWHEFSRSVFVQLHTILVMLCWAGAPGKFDDKRFWELSMKIQNQLNEQEAIDEVLSSVVTKNFPGAWKAKYQNKWIKLQARGLELLEQIKRPQEKLRYKCVQEFRFGDEPPQLETAARYSVWDTIYINPTKSNSVEAINWTHVAQLRSSFKEAIGGRVSLEDWQTLEVLVDVPYGKSSHQEIQIEKRNGELSNFTDITHLQQSIFDNPTRYNSVVRVFVSPTVFAAIETHIGEIRAAAMRLFYTKKMVEETM